MPVRERKEKPSSDEVTRLVVAYLKRRAPDLFDRQNEVTTEVLTRLWRHPPKSDRYRRYVYLVIRTVVAKLIKDQATGRARFQSLEAMLEDERQAELPAVRNETPESLAIAHETADLVVRCLDRMSASDRQILDLRFFEKRPFEAISQDLEITLSCAKMRYLRAVKSFRVIYFRITGEKPEF